MTRTTLALTLIAALTTGALAGPREVLVLQPEGRADKKAKARVDARVRELARGAGATVQPGDTPFADAAAAVGCDPATPTCKAEVVDMLGVDEVVITTVTPKPGGHEVLVQRVGKDGSVREGRATLGAAALATPTGDELAELAPLFGGAAPPGSTSPAPGATAISTTPAPTPGDPPADAPATSATSPLPAASEPPAPVISTAARPAGEPADARIGARAKLPVVGMVGGGALAIIGFMMWGQASDIRDQIDAAPTRTLADLQALADLESRGSSYAAWGNVMFLGGVALGGVSAYYFLKDRKARRAARTAHVTPALFDHGAGIALTIGGSP